MLGMIASLNERADRMSRPAALTGATTAATAALVTPSGSAKKRSRQSKFNPTLPDRRFEGDPKNHVPITKGVNRLSCEMCKYLHDLARLEGTHRERAVSKPRQMCHYCGVHLCDECFNPYHGR